MTIRPSILKRTREQAKREKAQEKADRKVQRSTNKQSRALQSADGEDPDIAGIVPGPQPPAEE